MSALIALGCIGTGVIGGACVITWGCDGFPGPHRRQLVACRRLPKEENKSSNQIVYGVTRNLFGKLKHIKVYSTQHSAGAEDWLDLESGKPIDKHLGIQIVRKLNVADVQEAAFSEHSRATFMEDNLTSAPPGSLVRRLIELEKEKKQQAFELRKMKHQQDRYLGIGPM